MSLQEFDEGRPQPERRQIVTIELFRLDPYCSSFAAQVVDIGTDHLVLDQTYFFPKSAEQTSDTGTVDGVPVVGVTRSSSGIRHVIQSTRAFAIGDFVRCQIDWSRRYRTMRLHSAQHLLQLALVATHDVGTSIGGSVGPRRATLDIMPTESSQQLELCGLERWMESVVSQRLVTVHETDASLDQRWHWHIDGLGTITCDGTHVRCTAEVGAVHIAIVETDNATIQLEVNLVDEAQ
jgi:Ser-tRNA(Ala) deacylase AlaX